MHHFWQTDAVSSGRAVAQPEPVLGDRMVSTWLSFLTLAWCQNHSLQNALGFMSIGLLVLVKEVFHTIARIVSLWSNQRIFAECEIDLLVCGRFDRIPS